jgi:mRNA-degrading endonuclease toxin of MazEF toxin-antitoxin module
VLSTNPPPGWYPNRGEVYITKLDKERPAIILSISRINKFALDVCVVGTTTVEHAKFTMRISLKAGDGGLRKDCWAKCDQVTTLERSFLQYPPIGTLSKDKFAEVEEQVKVCLGFLLQPAVKPSL